MLTQSLVYCKGGRSILDEDLLSNPQGNPPNRKVHVSIKSDSRIAKVDQKSGTRKSPQGMLDNTEGSDNGEQIPVDSSNKALTLRVHSS